MAIGPLVAHLSRRRPVGRIVFGAMFLLDQVRAAPRRHRRFDDRWVLALRVLGLLLAVLAASAPQLTLSDVDPQWGHGGRIVVLLDRSLSSRAKLDNGASVFEFSQRSAIDAVQRLPASAEVAVIGFDREATSETQGFVTPARAAAALGAIVPSLYGTDLRAALASARRLLDRQPGEVLLFSDQAGRGTVASAVDEISRLTEDGAAIVPFPVGPDLPVNSWIEQVRWAEGPEGGVLTLRLGRRGPPTEAACDVVLPDGTRITVFVDVTEAGGEKRVMVPVGTLGGVGTVQCDDPILVEDNLAAWHLPQAGASRVLVIDGDPGETPIRSEVYFLNLALAPFGGSRSDVGVTVAPVAGLEDLTEGAFRVVVLANVADPRAYGKQLLDFVHGGGTLVISGGDNVNPDAWNSALGPILPAQMRRVTDLASHGELGVALMAPTGSDPLLAPFLAGGAHGFARVRARAALGHAGDPAPGTRVPLKWEGGLPALLVRPVDRGAVVVWSSTLDLAWTDLPLQAVFVPMIQGIVRFAGASLGEGAIAMTGLVGQRMVVPLRDSLEDVVLVDPNGRQVAATVESGAAVFVATLPGSWRVDAGEGGVVANVAVGVDPSESDVLVETTVREVEAALAPERLSRTVDLAGWAWLGSTIAIGLAAALSAWMGRTS